MNEIINVYCDESGHLEHDNIGVMILGAVWCPIDKARQIAVNLREIKFRNGLPTNFELKWTKVSPGNMPYYIDILDYFFSNQDLHFRAIIIPDKSKLCHPEYNQSHDDWYYKMYFDMLKIILSPQDHYRIYLDIKDTRSAEKVKKLHNVLCNNMYDFPHEIIEWVNMVTSHQVEQIQLVDFLIGIISYANRGLTSSPAKQKLVEIMRQRSGYSLTRTTLYRENKINLFRWHAQEVA